VVRLEDGALPPPVGSVSQVGIEVYALEKPALLELLPGICQIVFPYWSDNWDW
jgi:hypothetical protein